MTPARRTCPITGAALAPGQHVAPLATQHWTPTLNTTLWLPQELTIQATKQTSQPDTGPITGTNQHPLPMSLQAAETQWVYANTWLTWTLELDPHHNPTTGWTGIHHAWNTRLKQLTTWPHAPQALDETQAATLQALQAIDQPRHTHYAGPCPQCGKPLHATPGHHHATCANRHKIPTTQANQQAYEHAANQAWPITQTQQILALIGLNISAATIRTWQQRGKLGNWGRLPGGGRAYKPAEIAQHAQTLRHAPQSP